MYNIAVIGCGVIGLTSAIEIQKEFKNIAKVYIFTENVSPNTTGDVSAGLWTPYLLQDTPIEKVMQWSIASRDYFINLWKTGYADEVGICVQPVTIFFDNKLEEPIEWLPITFGYQYLSEEYIQKVNKQLKKNYKDGCTFTALICEPKRLLPFLQKQFIQNGGKINMKKINNFEELSSYDVIVNCTGMYSEIIANDKKMVPMRGQVSRVKAPWQFHVMMESENGSYIIPNADVVVLGGTAQLGDYNTKVDENDKKTILEKCCQVVPAMKNAPIVEDSAGLRPSRSEVKLEIEIKRSKSNVLKIVHNYGHGGSGVTLSHGCALEAVQLVKDVLKYPNNSKL